MRDSSFKLSEEELLTLKLCKKLEYVVKLPSKKQEKLLKIIDWYVDAQISLMFRQEDEKRKGLIKVRTDNGVMTLTPKEFEDYKPFLREIKNKKKI